jgi:membrane protease YdiL (CAAX protease family)
MPKEQKKMNIRAHRLRWVAAVVFGTAVLVRLIDPMISRRILDIAPDGLGGTILVNTAMVAWYVLPTVFVLAWLHGWRRVGDELGMCGSFWHGAAYSFCFTVPMLVGDAVIGKITDIDLAVLTINQLRAAIREEIFYRAFLFGQLFRHGRWGFVPSVAVSAVVFAAGHLYQAQSVSNAVGVFVITFIGAIWFAWLFVAWEYNLWLPIGLHFWMNMWWELFQVGQTAYSGSVMVEVLRLCTVVASVAWTFYMMQQQQTPHSLRDWFWMQRQ